MVPGSWFTALVALPIVAAAPQDLAVGSRLDAGAAMAAEAPIGLAGLEALVGQPLQNLAAAPLVCGEARADGTTACRVARRYGTYVIDAPAPLTEKIRLRRLTLVIRGQTVDAISLETSPDSFHALTHLLKARFGPPAQSRSAAVRFAHGVQPRLTRTWRDAAVQASLTDPTPFNTLAVRIAAAPSPGGKARGT